MTKSELISALSAYPDNAQVIFNDDENENYKALTIEHISFLDVDLLPDLCPDNCPKIIIHLTKKKSSLERVLERSCTTECPRYSAGTCPYSYNEKEICPRVREFLKQADGYE